MKNRLINLAWYRDNLIFWSYSYQLGSYSCSLRSNSYSSGTYSFTFLSYSLKQWLYKTIAYHLHHEYVNSWNLRCRYWKTKNCKEGGIIRKLVPFLQDYNVTHDDCCTSSHLIGRCQWRQLQSMGHFCTHYTMVLVGPFVICILTNKSETLYRKVVSKMKNEFPNIAPTRTTIMTDFEKGLRNAYFGIFSLCIV